MPEAGDDDRLADGIDETVPHGAFATGAYGDGYGDGSDDDGGFGEGAGEDPDVSVHDASLEGLDDLLDAVGDAFASINPFDQDLSLIHI